VHKADYLDVAALERALTGADLVVCAYQGMPELLLEGQLVLLRVMERVGVKVRYMTLQHIECVSRSLENPRPPRRNWLPRAGTMTTAR
jgi:hypothetical protein